MGEQYYNHLWLLSNSLAALPRFGLSNRLRINFLFQSSLLVVIVVSIRLFSTIEEYFYSYLSKIRQLVHFRTVAPVSCRQCSDMLEIFLRIWPASFIFLYVLSMSSRIILSTLLLPPLDFVISADIQVSVGTLRWRWWSNPKGQRKENFHILLSQCRTST